MRERNETEIHSGGEGTEGEHYTVEYSSADLQASEWLKKAFLSIYSPPQPKSQVHIEERLFSVFVPLSPNSPLPRPRL